MNWTLVFSVVVVVCSLATAHPSASIDTPASRASILDAVQHPGANLDDLEPAESAQILEFLGEYALGLATAAGGGGGGGDEYHGGYEHSYGHRYPSYPSYGGYYGGYHGRY